MRTGYVGVALLAWLVLVSPVSAEQRGIKVEKGQDAAGKAQAATGPLEPVRGLGCYTFGDGDTPAKAKDMAMAQARQAAVESHRVFVKSATEVKNFQLENDLLQSASAGMLQDVQVESKEEKGREICITIAAKISPVKLEDLIQDRVKSKDVAQAAQAAVLAGGSAFGMKVWTNKPDGRFFEGDPLVVYVQSDRDGYLKVDYFQADRQVVHLVPNAHRGEVFVRAGQIYAFGGEGAPEQFIITPPFGSEAIKAFVSTQRIDDPITAGRMAEDSKQYLNELNRGLRGIRVEGGQTGSPGQWAEAAIGLGTQEKAVAEYNRMATGTRGISRRAKPPEPVKPIATTGTVGERPEVPVSPRP